MSLSKYYLRVYEHYNNKDKNYNQFIPLKTEQIPRVT